jgi:hypothetical protein
MLSMWARRPASMVAASALVIAPLKGRPAVLRSKSDMPQVPKPALTKIGS